jgi:hypothetical protein
VGQLGVNAHGEVLEPGRVTDCYLGLRLDPAEDAEAAGVLVVAPAALLHPGVPKSDGTVLYALLTGHPDRTPGQLVFLADLTVELRAWPHDTWTSLGVDPQAAVVCAILTSWRCGHLNGLRLGGLTAEEALALERPGYDLCARAATPAPRRPARPGLSVVAAPQQRTPTRRPAPVADTHRPRQCPPRTPGSDSGASRLR